MAPKIAASDWTTAVVHLLSAETRLTVSGSQRSQSTARKDDLTAAIAIEYARRLERALRADGPIQVYERRTQRTRRLNGRLNVTQWMRNVASDPALFPVTRDELSPDNDFTRGLSIVAGVLGRSAAGGEASSRLRRLQSAIIPGHPLPAFVNPSVGGRLLPTQWGSYRSTWDIAAPILRNRSVVGDPGHSNGLEVAVEPWPLLETLLERTLQKLTMQRSDLTFEPKRSHALLKLGTGRVAQSVEPDGALSWSHGGIAATFEAKYAAMSGAPQREHVFQALATAAALNSPLSVLVYPTDDAPKWYELQGFRGRPTHLVTVGLSLFKYRRGEGDASRADLIRALIEEAQTRSQPSLAA